MAKKVTNPEKDLGKEYEKEKGTETAGENEKTAKSGKDPMSPE